MKMGGTGKQNVIHCILISTTPTPPRSSLSTPTSPFTHLQVLFFLKNPELVCVGQLLLGVGLDLECSQPTKGPNILNSLCPGQEIIFQPMHFHNNTFTH